jgi:hypothetical protein
MKDKRKRRRRIKKMLSMASVRGRMTRTQLRMVAISEGASGSPWKLNVHVMLGRR